MLIIMVSLDSFNLFMNIFSMFQEKVKHKSSLGVTETGERVQEVLVIAIMNEAKVSSKLPRYSESF